MDNLLLVSAAGLLGGAINAIAGGGSFITFPALVLAGLPPISANQTGAFALLPAGLASAWAYKAEIRAFKRAKLPSLLISTLIGGGAGATLLLVTPSRLFDLIIPWLVLIGAITFTFGKSIQAHAASGSTPMRGWPIACFQFVLGAYGGYFGGAVGIMMMAGWTVFGLGDVRTLNGVKTIVVAAARVIAVLIFAIWGDVYWQVALYLTIAAVIGGYLGALVTRFMSADVMRKIISMIFFIVTAAFFYKGYG
ncbi:MAG: sulfite exporter TauE/SafE family protein [Alcaligenaceae bacterium]|nr:sulfite exporter TauE/SafE family protein [Alcaligenaceae bacterium]